MTPLVSDADVIVALADFLRAGDAGLEPTALELVQHSDQARAILERTKADLLVRLHNRSDDFAAAKALRAVSAAAARLSMNNGHSPPETAVPNTVKGLLAAWRTSGNGHSDHGLANNGTDLKTWTPGVARTARFNPPPANGSAVGHPTPVVAPKDATPPSAPYAALFPEHAEPEQRPVDKSRSRYLVWLPSRTDDLSPARAFQAVRTATARLKDNGLRSIALSSNTGDDRALGILPVVLRVAIALSLIWLVWKHPGPRQFLLAVLLSVAVLAWTRFSSSASHRWPKISAIGWATIPLLVLLNVLIALALLDVAAVSVDDWSTPMIIAFAVMVSVNLTVLKAGFSSPPDVPLELPPNYLDTLESADVLPVLHPSTDGEAPEPKRKSRRRPNDLRMATAAVAAIAAAVWIGYEHPGGPLLSLVAIAVGIAIPFTTDVSREQAIKMVLAVAVGVVTIDYIGWRFSVANWPAAWIAVPLLWAEVLGAIHLLGFQFTIWPRDPPRIEPHEDPTQHPIFIFVPTLNEGVAVLRPTLEGCMAARSKYLAHYPHAEVTIVVCNDGRAAKARCWRKVEGLARKLGVRCVTRELGGGAKAGNIENARQKLHATGDALLVIFDADQVPEPDFLLETIPPFTDTTVGWVQTGQYYANLKNPVARWADDQQSMFYNLLCPGKAALNSAFICGTNVVIRAGCAGRHRWPTAGLCDRGLRRVDCPSPALAQHLPEAGPRYGPRTTRRPVVSEATAPLVTRHPRRAPRPMA